MDLRGFEGAKDADGNSLFQVVAFMNDEPENRKIMEKDGLKEVDMVICSVFNLFLLSFQ